METNTHEYFHLRLYNYLRLSGSVSINTLTVYKSNLNLILKEFPEPDKADLLQLQNFALREKNDNTRKNICTLIRWLYNKVLNRNIQWYELPYPKKKRKVQPIYSNEDILKVLNVITNEKQKAMLALIIDSGLRVSEPCCILLSDCSSKQRSIILRGAKGDNDRIIYPSDYAWSLIKIYWKEWSGQHPIKYLFEGNKKGVPYTESSVRGFLKSNCDKAGVKYKSTHAIRRYSITWSVENGVPLNVIAEKSGHATSRTIEKHYAIHSPVYLKSVNSPLKQFANA